MICPNCKQPAVVAPRVYRNIQAYGPPHVLAKAECCGVGLLVAGRMVFTAETYTGDAKVDDWGETIRKGLLD